ncbi:MAG: FMN-binding protein [Prevotella sp.]
MKKKYFSFILGASFALFSLTLMSASTEDQVITKENGVTIVNTTSLTKDVKGFKGATPVKIFIKKNKVIKVEALPNRETPKYFERLKAFLTSWDGKSVSKASKAEPDAVSGATYSSNAVTKNVKAGLKYYQDNK